MNDEARRLVDALGTGEVPQVVAALRAKQTAGDRAEAAVATRDGRWLAFHATRMGGSDVVIVEQLRSHRLADLILRSRGLTSREREVVEGVARGLSTKAIAQALFIPEWTVQDHLKSGFAKSACGPAKSWWPPSSSTTTGPGTPPRTIHPRTAGTSTGAEGLTARRRAWYAPAMQPDGVGHGLWSDTVTLPAPPVHTDRLQLGPTPSLDQHGNRIRREFAAT